MADEVADAANQIWRQFEVSVDAARRNIQSIPLLTKNRVHTLALTWGNRRIELITGIVLLGSSKSIWNSNCGLQLLRPSKRGKILSERQERN